MTFENMTTFEPRDVVLRRESHPLALSVRRRIVPRPLSQDRHIVDSNRVIATHPHESWAKKQTSASSPRERRPMHTLRRQRSREVVKNVAYLLEAMAFDPRLVGGLRPFESMASAPSLRASDFAYRDSMGAGGDDAGNVKVVVRVRQFIPRGMYSQFTQ